MANWNYFAVYVIVAIGVASCCPNGWVTHNEKCYHFSHDTEDFIGAMNMCRLIGGQLVTIENSTEGDYLSNQVKATATKNFWIGLTDVGEEGTWLWVNNKESLRSTGYHHWLKGQPNNQHADQNCAYIDVHGLWEDGTCHGAYHYICEQGTPSTEIIG